MRKAIWPPWKKKRPFSAISPELAMGVNNRHGDIAASHGQLQKRAISIRRWGKPRSNCNSKASKRKHWRQKHGRLQSLAIQNKPSRTQMRRWQSRKTYSTSFLLRGVLAFAGENAKALQLASEVARERPDDTLVQDGFRAVSSSCGCDQQR